jgi:hypothetical protein
MPSRQPPRPHADQDRRCGWRWAPVNGETARHSGFFRSPAVYHLLYFSAWLLYFAAGPARQRCRWPRTLAAFIVLQMSFIREKNQTSALGPVGQQPRRIRRHRTDATLPRSSEVARPKQAAWHNTAPGGVSQLHRRGPAPAGAGIEETVRWRRVVTWRFAHSPEGDGLAFAAKLCCGLLIDNKGW